jgi:hypothetical protein
VVSLSFSDCHSDSDTGSPITFSIMKFSNPSFPHPRATIPYITCSDPTPCSFIQVKLCEDKVVYTSRSPGNLSKVLMLIWSWNSGTLLCVGLSNRSPIHSYADKNPQRLEVDYPGIIFNPPVLISSDNFLTVEPTDSEYEGQTHTLCLYELDNGKKSHKPFKLRSFLLPPFEGDYTLYISSTPSTPVYVGRKTRYESITASLLYADHDSLFHIIMKGPKVTQQYLLYPSVFISPRYYGSSEVPWGSWGPHNSCVFEYKCNWPEMLHLSAQGDRVAVCWTDDPSDDTIKEWYFHIMDFRPARVCRAFQIMRGQPVWPTEPFWDQSLSSSSRNGLGYMATRKLKLFASTATVDVDCERVLISKVGPYNFTCLLWMLNPVVVLRSCAKQILKLFRMSSHSDGG